MPTALDQHGEVLATRERECLTRLAIALDECVRDDSVVSRIVATLSEHEREASNLLHRHHRAGSIPVDQHQFVAVTEPHHIRGMQITVTANHRRNRTHGGRERLQVLYGRESALQ